MDDLRRYDTPGGDRVLAYGEHKMVCARSGGPPSLHFKYHF